MRNHEPAHVAQTNQKKESTTLSVSQEEKVNLVATVEVLRKYFERLQKENQMLITVTTPRPKSDVQD